MDINEVWDIVIKLIGVNLCDVVVFGIEVGLF